MGSGRSLQVFFHILKGRESSLQAKLQKVQSLFNNDSTNDNQSNNNNHSNNNNNHSSNNNHSNNNSMKYQLKDLPGHGSVRTQGTTENLLRIYGFKNPCF